jgi:FixJ family two-component response regulator
MKHPFLAIVDDESCIREFVAHVLAVAGVATQELANGREFLDHHHPATSGVILGLCMPVLNGQDTLREMWVVAP